MAIRTTQEWLKLFAEREADLREELKSRQAISAFYCGATGEPLPVNDEPLPGIDLTSVTGRDDLSHHEASELLDNYYDP